MNPLLVVRYLTLMELYGEKDLTEEKIKKNYRRLALLYHPDQAPQMYKDGEKFKELVAAKDFLLENIADVNIIIASDFESDYHQHDASPKKSSYTPEHTQNNQSTSRSKQAPKRKYNPDSAFVDNSRITLEQARETFDREDYENAFQLFIHLSISARVNSDFMGRHTHIHDILDFITGDEAVMYGICCVMCDRRFKRSHSFMYSYGYGGKWSRPDWFEEVFPEPDRLSADDVLVNIRNVVMEHPYIQAAHGMYISSQMAARLGKFIDKISVTADEEYTNRQRVVESIISNPSILAKYCGQENGFVIWNNNLFYIYYDHGNNSPIYRVQIENKHLKFIFYKFSNFSGCGSVEKNIDMTIKFATSEFIQLKPSSGMVPYGYTTVLSEMTKLNYSELIKDVPGKCKLCGGETMLGVCRNNCRRYIRK